MDSIFIIAGGPSLSGLDFKKFKKVDTIVVNKAIEHIPNPNYFITIDHSFMTHKVKKDIIEKSKASKFFVANYGPGTLADCGGAIRDVKNDIIYNLSMFDAIIRSKRVDGIGYNWNDFRSGNCSGFCALQLAVILGYQNIYLLGVDLKIDGDKTHYHGGYKSHPPRRMRKNLNEYARYFLEAARELESKINLVSCSKTSVLNDTLPYTSPAEALRSVR